MQYPELVKIIFDAFREGYIHANGNAEGCDFAWEISGTLRRAKEYNKALLPGEGPAPEKPGGAPE